MNPNPRIIIISAIILMILNYAYLPFSNIDYIMYPFPLKEKQYIYLTTYIDYLVGRYGSILFIWAIVYIYVPYLRQYLKIFGIFWVLFIIDYLLTYNEPMRYYSNIPMSYSFYMALCLIVWLWYDLLNNK